jgi:hypothetical protein
MSSILFDNLKSIHFHLNIYMEEKINEYRSLDTSVSNRRDVFFLLKDMTSERIDVYVTNEQNSLL